MHAEQSELATQSINLEANNDETHTQPQPQGKKHHINLYFQSKTSDINYNNRINQFNIWINKSNKCNIDRTKDHTKIQQ
ncbi:hypothetical protein TW78_05615 [Vibrio coralliilyticus]|uniref:Uncharacterized protein n=1 Tax=Vibrio coralliilyticus TaxID=190893 RepID=A0A837G1Z4_9VIBR|nr:hypothetical protein TW78_05615 [Vibrio coralliilyticus]